MKEIYSFTVKKKESVEKTEEQDDGKKIVETVEEEVPYSVVVKMPSRKEKADAERFNQKVFSQAVKDGIMTRAMIRKTYGDAGGIFTEEEEKERNKILEKYHESRQKIVELEKKEKEAKTKKDKAAFKEESEKEFDKFLELHQKLELFNSKEEEIYVNSAENIARNKTVELLICELSFIKDGDNYKEAFEGSDLEEKNAFLEDKLEEDPDFYGDLLSRVSSVVSMWYEGRAREKEDFDEAFKILFPE